MMALTLDKEQMLKAVGLVEFFDEDRALWCELAKKSHDYVKGNFPAESPIRRDDVAKVLKPIIEVNEDLRDYLNENKLKQKYWILDFTDLVIDRTWDDISKGEPNAEKKE
jgi:hypothetical protein